MTINTVNGASENATLTTAEIDATRGEGSFTNFLDEMSLNALELALDDTDESDELIRASLMTGMDRPSAPGVGGNVGDKARSLVAPGSVSNQEMSPAEKQIQNLQEQIDGMEEQANDLDARSEASSDPIEANNLSNEAQVLRNRIIALENRIETIEDRILIEEKREVGGITPVVPEPVVDIDVFDPPEVVEIYQSELTAIPGFEAFEVSASRGANEAEVDLFLELATGLGAKPADLALIEGFEDAFPLQFVFVDNFASDYGFDVAVGGAFTVNGTSTIVLDGRYKDSDFTTLSPGEDPELAQLAVENVAFGMNSILEIFDLPGDASDALTGMYSLGSLSGMTNDDDE